MVEQLTLNLLVVGSTPTRSSIHRGAPCAPRSIPSSSGRAPRQRAEVVGNARRGRPALTMARVPLRRRGDRRPDCRPGGDLPVRPRNPHYPPRRATRPGGGTGRRAALRGQWPRGRAGSSPAPGTIHRRNAQGERFDSQRIGGLVRKVSCGRSSVVERDLPKVDVVGSIPTVRSRIQGPAISPCSKHPFSPCPTAPSRRRCRARWSRESAREGHVLEVAGSSPARATMSCRTSSAVEQSLRKRKAVGSIPSSGTNSFRPRSSAG